MAHYNPQPYSSIAAIPNLVKNHLQTHYITLNKNLCYLSTTKSDEININCMTICTCTIHLFFFFSYHQFSIYTLFYLFYYTFLTNSQINIILLSYVFEILFQDGLFLVSLHEVYTSALAATYRLDLKSAMA